MVKLTERRKFSLRAKFIFLSTILVTLIIITVTYLFTIRELHSKRLSAESQIQRIAENVATMQLLDRQDWTVYQNYISRLIDFNKDIVYIAIYDDRLTLRAHSLNSELIEMQSARLNRRQEAQIVKRLDEGAIADESRADLRTQRVNIQMGDRILGSVHVGFSLIKINNELREAIFLIIGLAAFFFMVFTAVSVFISGRLTGPLERLSNAMTAVANGNLDQVIEIETGDEIGQLSKNFNEMVGGLKERKIIESLAGELRATFILKELALSIRERIGTAIGASNTRLYIRDNKQSDLFEEITVQEKGSELFLPIHLTPALREYITLNIDGFMIHDSPEFVLKGLQHDLVSPNGLVIPMMVKDELLGMLFFALPQNQLHFDTKNQRFAAMLASQATLALENALLYEKQQEQERFKRELEIAREVQQKLLPASMPETDGFQLEGFCRSAQEVGGDYYDFFQLDESRLGIVIADVSGKGTSASFYMAEIKGMMLQLASRMHSPRELLSEINKHLYANVDRHLFVTMIYGILDQSVREFIFARAGHNSLLAIRSDGSHLLMTPSGIGLGLDEGALFQKKILESKIKLSRGDMLVFYTDGITEAMNHKFEEFGEERLVHFFLHNFEKPLSYCKEEILKTLKTYMGNQPQHDDLTMVILRCEK